MNKTTTKSERTKQKLLHLTAYIYKKRRRYIQLKDNVRCSVEYDAHISMNIVLSTYFHCDEVIENRSKTEVCLRKYKCSIQFNSMNITL